MRILIAGGGIGGIATAIGLRKEGHEPLVIEQAPKLGFVGQGINLGANAVKALRYLGAADRVNERAIRTRGWVYHELSSGDVQLEIPIGDRYGGEQYISTHRADLLDALVAQLDPGDLRLGSRIEAIEEHPDSVSVRLTDGTTLSGDILVGADGVKSVVRNTLYGDDSSFARFVTWRAALPREAAPEAASRRELRMWSGSGKFFVLYPIRDDLVNMSAYVPAERPAVESWTAGGDVAELREVFGEGCDEVQRALDGLQNPLLTGIYVRNPLPRWVTDRIALIGDAAHSMGPFSGNGGGLAIEDAVTLAICLGRATDAASAAAALRDYEQRRIGRTTKLQVDARARMFSLRDPHPDTPRIRAGIWAGMTRIDPFNEAEYGWLYEHDPVASARLPWPDAGDRYARADAQRAFAAWRGALTFDDHAGAWRGRRAGYERFLEGVGRAPEPTAREHDVAGVPTLQLGSAASAHRIVLHLHGGGYSFGSARTAFDLADRIGRAAEAPVVVPDYRLAPEHPFPAALDDALAVYRGLVSAHPDAEIVVTGEDAGGGLAIALTARLRDAGEKLPAALFLASPFADLTVASPSMTSAAGHDGWLTREFATALATSYVQHADPADAEVSPVRASLHGFPPLLVVAAENEALADDARAIAAAAEAAHAEVELLLVPDSVHSFVLFDSLPESADALGRLARLLATTRSLSGG